MRVVLGINVLVSALIFSAGRLQWLRRAWQDGAVVPLLGHETAKELLRVLRYPKFRLSAGDREELLADLLPYCETVTGEPRNFDGPRCRDPEDEKFLDLARAAAADALVTGDDDLIALAGRFEIEILTPAQLYQRLDGEES